MNEDIPKIGCVQHDCDACANQAERVAALEAKVAQSQAICLEEAERVTKEIKATKLLRAALEAVLTTRKEESIAHMTFESALKNFSDHSPEEREYYAATIAASKAEDAARKALEATK